MAYFIVLHTRYQDIQLGLFNDIELLDLVTIPSKISSKTITNSLDALLATKELKITDLAFIAAHQGPAPYTTLRVALATVNGLSYATGIPLIGVNGLTALIDMHPTKDDYILALLNAFSGDLYYALYEKATNMIIKTGSSLAKDLIPALAEKYAGSFLVIGNGAELHQLGIQEYFGKRAHIIKIEIASLEQIGKSAFDQFQNCDALQTKLYPIYLKNQFGTASF